MAKNSTTTASAPRKTARSKAATTSTAGGTPTAQASPKIAAAANPASECKPCPSHAEVAKRAFEIWVRKGRPVGRDLENWNDAERELGLKA